MTILSLNDRICKKVRSTLSSDSFKTNQVNLNFMSEFRPARRARNTGVSELITLNARC